MLQGEISTSMLIRMSNQEMASKEKIEWREKLEKDDIDRRKKLEEERQKEVFPRTFYYHLISEPKFNLITYFLTFSWSLTMRYQR